MYSHIRVMRVGLLHTCIYADVHDVYVFSASRLHAYCVRTHVNDVICVSYVIMYESIHIQRLADNLQNVYIQCVM